MKRLSLGLTVLLLAGVPVVAAAFDYGANAPLLAENAGSPTLPDATAVPGSDSLRAAMTTATSEDNRSAADGDSASSPSPQQRATPSGASSHPTPVRPDAGTTTRNEPQASASNHPRAPATASWQSLLPGSIQ